MNKYLKIEAYINHYDYLKSVKNKLIAAEKIIDSIKDSCSWKKSINYFWTLYKRGLIDERPMKENGYKLSIPTDGEHPSLKDHIEYLRSVIPALVTAEKTVDKIKSTDPYIKAMNYFNLLYSRKQLPDRPLKSNEYKLIEWTEIVKPEDIDDYLLAEQKEINKHLKYIETLKSIRNRFPQGI